MNSDIERYDYAFDPDGDEWAARLLRRVPAGGGTVLELGPGPGAMTRVLLARGHRVTVVENDPQALEVLQTLGVEVIAGNLDGTDWLQALAGRRFDTVLACDVLEHLRKPEDVLQRLGEFVAPLGSLLISVPNIAYAGVLASMRCGTFDYSDKGQLDRTHVRFFTRRSLETVLLDAGWAPRVWEANRVPLECSEFAWHWSALSGEQRQALMAGWQDFDVYQWMVVVTPSIDAPTWELAEARGAADSLRSELQALTVVHQRERASLIEHQKAFAEAKEVIAKMQHEIGELRADVDTLRAEKATVEAELAAEKARPAPELPPPPPPVSPWRRLVRKILGSPGAH
jgi:SAM-dependent methyltransferase